MITFRSMHQVAVALAMFAGFAIPSVVRAEMKDNPEFAAWAKHKPGTVAVYATEIDGGAVKMTMEMTSKLVEVKADKVVVEQTTTMTISGQARTRPAKQRDIPAKKDITTETKDIGEEDVEVAGKKIHCKVKEGTTETPGPGGKTNESKGKIYLSDAVPGGIVKLVATTAQGSMTMTMKSFEIK